jgi:hypothetical protein
MGCKPLDSGSRQVRLLNLDSVSNPDDPVICHFTYASLNDEPKFEALSYFWGQSRNDRSIELQGEQVQITDNLYSALWRLRRDKHGHEQERILWVDALCINQLDLEERKQQIALMRIIYGQAWRVVVWLGEEWHGSGVAMEFLRRLGEDATLHLNPARAHSITVDGRGVDSQNLRSHLCRLFDLPWWKRTWTVQEFVLAQELILQCGSTWITGDSLDRASQNFWNHEEGCCQIYELENLDPILGTSLVSSFVTLGDLYFVINSLGYSYSVLFAVATFSQRKATDDRDKVYGMLGLGRDKYADLVDADYSRSKEEVCKDLAFKSVEKTGTLEFLSHVFVHENDNLPSFIPNWTGSYMWSKVYRQRLHSISSFNASLDATAAIEHVSSSSIMMLGVVFDTIDVAASQMLFEGDLLHNVWKGDLFQDGWEELHRLAGIRDNSTQPYPHSGESRLVALWHSVCGGTKTLLKDSDKYLVRLNGSSDLSSYWTFNADLPVVSKSNVDRRDPDIKNIYSNIGSATWGRRFFRTESGYFGFGPQSCRAGDVIAVLAGGAVPYVLRPLPCPREGFTILGDSYVHGIMDGEVFEILPEGEREFRSLLFY